MCLHSKGFEDLKNISTILALTTIQNQTLNASAMPPTPLMPFTCLQVSFLKLIQWQFISTPSRALSAVFLLLWQGMFACSVEELFLSKKSS
jgi:hypothetical protein